jgi:DNA-binding NtrC family response regulator
MQNMGRILLVEDNSIERRALSQVLQRQGYTVFGAADTDKALGYIGDQIDVILCDQFLGATSGIELMSIWKKCDARTQFVILARDGSIENAVEAIKAGAFGYLAKPLSDERIVLLVRHALSAQLETESAKKQHDQQSALDMLVGVSQQMKWVHARIQRAARVGSTVLILGENGTGKELVARALHSNSPRSENSFVPVNVAAVPAGLVESELFGHVRGAFTGATDRRMGRFEQANEGTLFIDEIGDFNVALQPKLLRVLESLSVTPVGGNEEINVDVRVIAATSRDIEKMVHDGTFREDLYYRLNVVKINLPPLRERMEDIPVLAEHFVRQIVALRQPVGRKISPQVMQRLVHYRWPGNVRELKNTLESMLVLADSEMLTEQDLPEHILHGASEAKNMPVGLTIGEVEKRAIMRALESCRDNRTRAAEQLGISVRTLQRKLHEYAIVRPESADEGDNMSQL